MTRFIMGMLIAFSTIQSGNAQINITTDSRLVAVHNNELDTYVPTGEAVLFVTYIEINKDITLLKHTTPEETSVYVIKRMFSEKDESGDIYFFDMRDVNGYEFLCFFDPETKTFSYLLEAGDDTYLVIYHIKTSWIEE